jgi:hypothetical protein
MIFSKIFFGIWLARKNYKNAKIEFGKCCWNPATFGSRCRIPARKFDRIRPKWPDSCRKLSDPGRFGQIRPESSRSAPINGRIQSYSAILARSQQYSGRNLVAGIRRRQDTGDRMLSDSGAG